MDKEHKLSSQMVVQPLDVKNYSFRPYEKIENLIGPENLIVHQHIQLARYISASIALKYGTSGSSRFCPFQKDEMKHFSHQVVGKPLRRSMDMFNPYKMFYDFLNIC